MPPPPGVWTQEAAPASPPSAPFTGWCSWAEVPTDPFQVIQVAARGPFFVEFFSGTARLTAAVRSLGRSLLAEAVVAKLVPITFQVSLCISHIVHWTIWGFARQTN